MTVDREPTERRWNQITPTIWVLSGEPARQIAERGPYLNEASKTYTVTGPGYESTDHRSFVEAKAAAEASVDIAGC